MAEIGRGVILGSVSAYSIADSADAQHYDAMGTTSATTLQLGMGGWIISDGNYTDFRIGEVRSFAIEYHNQEVLRPLPVFHAKRSHRLVEACRYAVTGKTIHLADRWVAIDIGVAAYSERRSPSPPPPERFEGEIWLGIDPFPYFERYANERGAPPLIYDWQIHRIQVETAPRILQDGMSIYDPERLRLEDVEDTRKGEDFVLHCELLPAPPRWTLGES